MYYNQFIKEQREKTVKPYQFCLITPIKRILFYQGSTLVALNKILHLFANIWILKFNKKYLYSQFFF